LEKGYGYFTLEASDFSYGFGALLGTDLGKITHSSCMAFSLSPYPQDSNYYTWNVLIGIAMALIVIFILLALGFLMRSNLNVSPRIVLGLAGYVLIPMADNLSDLAYLMSGNFITVFYFALLFSFYLLQMTGFFRILLKRKAWCKFHILSMPQWLFFDEYNNLFKFLATALATVPFLVVNIYVLPLLFAGMFLWAIKAFTLRCYSDTWFKLWTGRDDVNQHITSAVDTEMLNDSLVIHLLLESIPSFFISTYNNAGVYGQFYRWGVFAQMSFFVSFANICAGLYRIAFYRLYLGIKLDVIPIDFSLFGLNIFSVSAEELEAIASEGKTGLIIVDKEWGSSTRSLSFRPSTNDSTPTSSPLSTLNRIGRGELMEFEMRVTDLSGQIQRSSAKRGSGNSGGVSSKSSVRDAEELALLLERQGSLEHEVHNLKRGVSDAMNLIEENKTKADEEMLLIKGQLAKLGVVVL